MYFVEIKTYGYPNGVLIKSKLYQFNSYETAKDFVDNSTYETPYSTTTGIIFTFIDNKKVFFSTE